MRDPNLKAPHPTFLTHTFPRDIPRNCGVAPSQQLPRCPFPAAPPKKGEALSVAVALRSARPVRNRSKGKKPALGHVISCCVSCPHVPLLMPSAIFLHLACLRETLNLITYALDSHYFKTTQAGKSRICHRSTTHAPTRM